MSTQKTSSANSRALWKKGSALCTQYFWEYCTRPLHAISHGSNWEENYSVHSVLKHSRCSLSYLMTQGVHQSQLRDRHCQHCGCGTFEFSRKLPLDFFFPFLHWNWPLKGILIMPAALVTWTKFSSTKLIWIEMYKMYKQCHNPDATSQGNSTTI